MRIVLEIGASPHKVDWVPRTGELSDLPVSFHQNVRCSAIWINLGLPIVCASCPKCPYGGIAYPTSEQEKLDDGGLQNALKSTLLFGISKLG